MKAKKNSELKWDKLDNTANLFPIIASESTTSVYRLAVTLTEDVDGEYLQQALNIVLPKFDIFNSRLRKGVFWFYFETNGKEAPVVEEENSYPCRFISRYNNKNYLFRVTYYKKRINLEVFHVLTDGMGGVSFLKELTYQYLRIAHKKELGTQVKDELSSETSLSREDSYSKNYKKTAARGYKTEKAFKIKGEALGINMLGVIHGYLPIGQLKLAAKKYGLSLNEYLVSVYTYAIYKEKFRGQGNIRPITITVPVNLRPYFDSITTKNFFTVVTACFKPTEDEYGFEQILAIVRDSLREQITKENLERLISYGVSNERKLIVRAIPLFIKSFGVKQIYKASAKANTTTLTNVGNVQILEPYQKYIQHFYTVLSMTEGQNIKVSLISYNQTMVLTFSSGLKETEIQRAFFRKLADDGVEVTVESNGVYYE